MQDPDILVDLRHQNMNGSNNMECFGPSAGSSWMSVLPFKKEGMTVCAHVWPRR